jgi:hypothetical protein
MHVKAPRRLDDAILARKAVETGAMEFFVRCKESLDSNVVCNIAFWALSK